MGWSTLARYAGWAALILGFFGIIGWALYQVHSSILNKGIMQERSKWEQREILKANANARETSRLAELAANERAKWMKEIKNAENRRLKLAGDIIDLKVAGLSITAECGRGSAEGAGENSNTGVDGGGSTRIRLPGSVESGILGMTENAQICVIKYDTLRKKMKSLPNVEIVPDS